MKKITVGIMLLFFLCQYCHAVEYNWPITVGVEEHTEQGSSPSGASQSLYFADVYISTARVKNDEIDAKMTLRQVLRKYLPGYMNGSEANWGPFASVVPKEPNSSRPATVSVVFAYDLDRHPELLDRPFVDFANNLAATMPSKTLVRIWDINPTLKCGGSAMFVNHLQQTTDTFESWKPKTWNGGVPGGTTCLSSPPISEWCAMATPSVTFNYGTITVQDAQGSQRDANVNVQCSAGMKFSLRLRGGNSIALSNGQSVTLTADGKALGETLTAESGIRPVTLRSTLTGTPLRTGAFEGSDVLYVSYP